MPFLLVAVVAYLLGSIPFGLLLTRLAGLGDIRRIGSGNIGATNVLRTGSKGLAAATLLLDAGKGALAVLLAQRVYPETTMLAAVAVVLGHLFPIWLGFRGGKGVATALGALAAFLWPVALMASATWLAVAVWKRYSSLAAIVACALAPVFTLVVTRALAPTATVLIIALLVLARHRANIGRLLRGQESRISLGQKN
jgi:glycerol-3-phosphate acyltransferase PlsY